MEPKRYVCLFLQQSREAKEQSNCMGKKLLPMTTVVIMEACRGQNKESIMVRHN